MKPALKGIGKVQYNSLKTISKSTEQTFALVLYFYFIFCYNQS